MQTMHSILALDIGTATLHAAVLDSEGIARVLLLSEDTVGRPALLSADQDTIGLARFDDATSAVAELRSLMKPGPFIIGRTEYWTTRLLQRGLEPVLAAAEQTLSSRPTKLLLAAPLISGSDLLQLQIAAIQATGFDVTCIPYAQNTASAVPAPPEHRLVMVIDCGAAHLTATFVRGTATDPVIAGVTSVPGGGDAVDSEIIRCINQRVGGTETVNRASIRAARAARHRLAHADTTKVALPDAADVRIGDGLVDQVATRVLRNQVRTLMAKPITGNGPAVLAEGLELESIVLIGGLANDPAIAEAVTDVTGMQPVIAPHAGARSTLGALEAESNGYLEYSDLGPLDLANEPVYDDDEQEPEPSAPKARRWLAPLEVAAALAIVVALVAGMVWLFNSPEGVSRAQAEDLISNELPGDDAIAGMVPKRWTAHTTATIFSTGDELTQSWACGHDVAPSSAEKSAIQVAGERVWVPSTESAPTSAESWQLASANTFVMARSAVLNSDKADALWSSMNDTNMQCPDTERQAVRHVVVIPQSGADPGPPRYTTGGTDVLSDVNDNDTADDRAVRTVPMNPRRQAWRGLAEGPGGETINVTCIADMADKTLRQTCAANPISSVTDQLAVQTMLAYGKESPKR